ncbi:unnamed protein product [Rodentolepis nana]|uniref:Uncharacterized protein n=1 Tax=Rodentolepis nana TaxID=102285 RepID=A0A0R3TYM2_RODNA|nr:unnamed protein product [Rodentolepis nana]
MGIHTSSTPSKFFSNSGGCQLEKKLNFCKYDLDEKDRILTKLSTDVDQRLRSSFSQPNHLNFIHDTQTKIEQRNSKYGEYGSSLKEESDKLDKHSSELNIEEQNALIVNTEIPYRLVKHEQDKTKKAVENFRGSLNHIADQQQTIEILKVDGEYTKRYAMEMDERYKNLVDWMHVIVTSTKPPSSAQEEFDFSNDAVQRLKTEIAFSITKSRENTVLIEELKDEISSKNLQISHLKSVISQLTRSGVRRLDDNFEEPQQEPAAMNAVRIENAALKKRLNTLELQLDEARNRISRFEDNSVGVSVENNNHFADSRQSLSDLLNRSAWRCNDSEEEILEVVRRVLTALANNAEECSRLQIKLSEVVGQLADAERKLECLEGELLALRSKQSQSLTKSVEFLNRTTDLEDSHERLMQFLRQLESRLPVDQSVFVQMSVADRRNFILGFGQGG